MITSIINNYNYKKFDGKYLLTTTGGTYCVLTEEEYNEFRSGILSTKLESKLLNSYILIDKVNFTEYMDMLSLRNDSIFKGTGLHIIVVTLRCNMSCIYCQVGRKYVDKEGYDMDIKTARQTVDFIFQSPDNNITIEFQGGEPTLNWDVVKEVIKYAEEKNKEAKKELHITIVTNMTTMDNEKMNYLINHDVAVCTSLDGIDVVHNENRKYDKNNYNEVITWIKKFNEGYKHSKSNQRVNALVTLTKLGLRDVKGLIDQYAKLELDMIHFRCLTKLGFAKNAWEKISYPVADYLHFWKEGVEYIEELKSKGVNINERIVDLIYAKFVDNEDPGFVDLSNPCGAAIGQLAYDTNGNVYTCDEARMMKDEKFKLGNVKINKYEDVIGCQKCFDVVCASTLETNDSCQICVYLPFCGDCPVLNYSECRKLKCGEITKSDRCKINKFQFDWVVKRFFLNNQK